jgi:hypothetical protein
MPSLLLARPLSCLASCANSTRPRPPPTARPFVSMLPGLAHRRPPEPPPPCPARVLPPPGLPIHGRLFVLLPRLASFAMTDRPGRHHRTRPCPPIGEEGWRPLLVKKVSILVKAAYLVQSGFPVQLCNPTTRASRCQSNGQTSRLAPFLQNNARHM